MELDLKNKQILHELDRNAKTSYSELSKKIKLSKNSVINRINELERNETILGYNTLININNLGYTTYDIYLKFRNTSLETEQEIIHSLIKNKDVWLVAKVEGNINLSILISTKTPEEFNAIWTSIYEKIKPHITINRIAILLEYHHFTRGYLLGKPRDHTTIIGRRKNLAIDETDELILRTISKNARLPLLEISKKLGLNSRTIAHRIRNLEKEHVILGYKTNLNFRKLGYTYYKIMLTLNDLSIIPKLYSYIKEHKNAVYYDKFLGGADFEFDMELESFDAFVTFIDELKITFGNKIENYEYLNPTIIYKSTYY